MELDKSAQKNYTFLGAGNAALAMYIDILYELHQKDFAIKIVENIHVEDDTPYLIEGIVCEKIFHTDWQPQNNSSYIIGVNKPGSKFKVYSFFKANYGIDASNYTKLVHPSAIVSVSSSLAGGVVLNPGVVIAPFSHLGNLVSVNRNVSIGHHTTIGDFSTLQPETNVAGKCKLGAHVTVGMGATIIDGITIGENSVIGAGSLVTRDIPAGVVAYGVPAKVIREVGL